MTRSLSHSEAPPPGAFSTSSAQPAQTNDIASVTTMSGTRVITTSVPLIAPEQEAKQQHGDDHDEAERLRTDPSSGRPRRRS